MKRDEETGLGMDDTAVSWFGSLLPFGCIAGSLVPVIVLKRFGCKWPLLALALTQIAGFVIIASATKQTAFLAHIGRALSGFAAGKYNFIVPSIAHLYKGMCNLKKNFTQLLTQFLVTV